MEQSKSSSEMTRAYNYILENTINFGFQPGTRINEMKLSKQLGMSRAPIREALNKLAAEGFVILKTGRGFFCRDLTIKELADLFEVRSNLELPSVQTICRNSPKEDLINLHNECIDIEKNNHSIDIDTLVGIDENFHMRLLTLANNEERINFMKNINKRIRFIRQINLESPIRRDKFLNEHIQIIESIMDRDEKRSLSLMEQHLYFDSENLGENIKEGLIKIYNI